VSAFDWSDDEDWFAVPRDERAAIVKTAVSMPEVAELCGYDVASGDKIRPPWNPTERTPSTHLYEDHFYDYGSGRHGDLFDWIREEDVAQGAGEPRSLGAAVSYIRKLALKGGKEPGDVEVVPVRKLENLIGLLPATAATDVAGVDVTPFPGITRDAFGVVYVPHAEYVDGDPFVYGIKLRHPNGKKTSVPGSQFTHRLYHPTAWTPPRSDTVIICEGESDCWAMWHVAPTDVDVLALPSGAGAWKDHWLEDLEPYRTVHLCFDNDHAGKQALDKVTRKIGWDRAHHLAVPTLYNDVREAVTAGWRPNI
jgi:hypothetical protein